MRYETKMILTSYGDTYDSDDDAKAAADEWAEELAKQEMVNVEVVSVERIKEN